LPEARRQALIEATIQCLKRYGHEGLSVRKISAQAAVSIGLINHHFPNKDELVAQAYRHFNSQLLAGVRAAVELAPHSPRQRLSAFIRASFAPPNLDQDVLSAWVVFWSLHRHSPAIRKAHDDSYRGYLQLLHSMLGELANATGPFPLGLRLGAIGLTALLDGLWLEWCLDPETFQPEEAIALCEAWIAQLH
jgi:AcrR family transcriptional regulator